MSVEERLAAVERRLEFFVSQLEIGTGVPTRQQKFNMVIGQLDLVLSELMIYGREAQSGTLEEANRQTLKHHVEDMEAAAKAIFKRLGIQEGTPQPYTTK